MSDSVVPVVEVEGTEPQAKKQKHEEESIMDLGFASRYVVWTKEVRMRIPMILGRNRWSSSSLCPLTCVALAQEDEALKKLVDSLGAKNWAKIAEQMPNRTSKSCRLR